MSATDQKQNEKIEIEVEPGDEERWDAVLRRMLKTPPKPHVPKPKTKPPRMKPKS